MDKVELRLNYLLLFHGVGKKQLTIHTNLR